MTTLPASGAGSLTANDTDDDDDVLEVIAARARVARHGRGAVRRLGALHADANYNGPDSFVYTVSDGLMTSSATVTIDVRFGNIAPVAINDFYTVNEDTTLSVPAATGLLENDTDVEHDVLSAVLTSLPAHGQLTLNSARRLHLHAEPRTTPARTPSPTRRSTAQAYSDAGDGADQRPAGERSAGHARRTPTRRS